MLRLFVFAISFLFAIPRTVLADSKSDYEYQYTKYRDSYLEFSIFKKDYLNTPSLDNQQKVLLSLKQSLVSRDLAKASLAGYLFDLIQVNKIDYSPMVPILQGLSNSRQYFISKSNDAQSLVTLENLKNYDKEYLKTSIESERYLKFGIVAHKIASLVRIQSELSKALEKLKYKIPNETSARLLERLTELENDHAIINEKIDTIAEYLISEEGQENVDSPIFFTGRIEKLSEIRELQLDWVDKLIDLDLNYGKI